MGEASEDRGDFGWVDAWLSPERFQRYLAASGGDRSCALRLYEWNLGLGAVLLKDIARFEVALRNAYDRVLREGLPGDEHWLFDPTSPVNVALPRRVSSGEIRDANALNRKAILQTTPKGNRVPIPGSVISRLPLGFWAHMTDRAHERVLWIPHLKNAWPSGTSRSWLDREIRIINTCRNRIAHHEHLFDPVHTDQLPLAVDSILRRLLTQLIPEGPWASDAHAELENYLRENPAPAVIDIGIREHRSVLPDVKAGVEHV